MARVILNLVVTSGKIELIERTFSLTDVEAEKYYRPDKNIKEKVQLALERTADRVSRCASY